jgi:hypothetical protein
MLRTYAYIIHRRVNLVSAKSDNRTIAFSTKCILIIIILLLLYDSNHGNFPCINVVNTVYMRKVTGDKWVDIRIEQPQKKSRMKNKDKLRKLN